MYITFDDALTAELDQNYFTDLFSSFTNPNGCPIRGKEIHSVRIYQCFLVS